MVRVKEVKTAIITLKGYSARALEYMDIIRCEIEKAVRFATATNDSEFNQNTVA
ncbi:MAG: hypothetical protein ACI845_003929 [Gammaproteobacteria bacterium]|jgi:hypothetical protein